MKTILLPLGLLAVGVGAGVGAGLLLAPPAEGAPTAGHGAEAGHAPEGAGAQASPAGAEQGAPADADAGHGNGHGASAGHDYVRLNNQFVVPVVAGDRVASLVIMSLSVEVPAGGEEAALLIEPKLRDIFLQVLFDHANTGGFEGLFTATSAMRSLRGALLAAARAEVGDLVTDVLILDLVRQDR